MNSVKAKFCISLSGQLDSCSLVLEDDMVIIFYFGDFRGDRKVHFNMFNYTGKIDKKGKDPDHWVTSVQ